MMGGQDNQNTMNGVTATRPQLTLAAYLLLQSNLKRIVESIMTQPGQMKGLMRECQKLLDTCQADVVMPSPTPLSPYKGL